MADKQFSGRVPPSGIEAVESLRRAMAAHQAGRLAEAEALYRRVLAGDKKQFVALTMLGVLNGQTGNYHEAERLLRSAVRVNPNDAGCQFNYGNVLVALGRFDEALAAFEETLRLNPGLAEAHLNRGSILMARKRSAEAVACFDAAIGINSGYAAAYCNRGNALEELRRFDEALASYDKALAIQPGNGEFHASRANALYRLKRHDEALAGIAAALAIAPNNADFHYNRGNISFELKRHGDAVAAYDAALRLNPDLKYAAGDRYFARMMICDWSNLDVESEQLANGVAAGRTVARPLPFLTVESSTALQTKCANIFADDEFPPALLPLWTGRRYRHDRIRLAYLSADFRQHPVSHLLAGMIERHDRARFETIGLSFGVDDASPLRRRMESAFERFIDVRDKDDAEIAQWLRANEIDIAVDLMGPTQNARPAILSYRPAPIQVIYLGYAGSSGALYVDYILGDRIVIPESERHFYREKVVYLPDTFMGTDDARKIAEKTPTRAEEGLPETGVVFCSFNNSYKITPHMFDIWMRLLRAVDGSVLWLSGTNDAATENLRREAEARSVGAERLVFARRVERNEDHLARYRLADLFLDTLPLGAHSTAVDALWAGAPVLTCAGATFSGRVSASLLAALGMPELVAGSLQSYEDMALKLAREPQVLAALRAKLAENSRSSPLFDTARFTRHIEAAYTSMWRRWQAGEAPGPITIGPIDG